MTIEQMQKVVQWLRAKGEDVEANREYRGREAFGSKVPAIKVCPRTALSDFYIGYAFGELGLPMKDIPYHSDSFGYDAVYY